MVGILEGIARDQLWGYGLNSSSPHANIKHLAPPYFLNVSH